MKNDSGIVGQKKTSPHELRLNKFKSTIFLQSRVKASETKKDSKKCPPNYLIDDEEELNEKAVNAQE